MKSSESLRFWPSDRRESGSTGELLFLLARRRGMTQKQFAAQLGVTQGTMSRKLSGASPWTLAELDLACWILGTSIGELFSRESVEGWGQVHAQNETRRAVRKYGIRDSNPEPADLEQFARSLKVVKGGLTADRRLASVRTRHLAAVS